MCIKKSLKNTFFLFCSKMVKNLVTKNKNAPSSSMTFYYNKKYKKSYWEVEPWK